MPRPFAFVPGIIAFSAAFAAAARADVSASDYSASDIPYVSTAAAAAPTGASSSKHSSTNAGQPVPADLPNRLQAQSSGGAEDPSLATVDFVVNLRGSEGKGILFDQNASNIVIAFRDIPPEKLAPIIAQARSGAEVDYGALFSQLMSSTPDKKGSLQLLVSTLKELPAKAQGPAIAAVDSFSQYFEQTYGAPPKKGDDATLNRYLSIVHQVSDQLVFDPKTNTGYKYDGNVRLEINARLLKGFAQSFFPDFVRAKMQQTATAMGLQPDQLNTPAQEKQINDAVLGLLSGNSANLVKSRTTFNPVDGSASGAGGATAGSFDDCLARAKNHPALFNCLDSATNALDEATLEYAVRHLPSAPAKDPKDFDLSMILGRSADCVWGPVGKAQDSCPHNDQTHLVEGISLPSDPSLKGLSPPLRRAADFLTNAMDQIFTQVTSKLQSALGQVVKGEDTRIPGILALGKRLKEVGEASLRAKIAQLIKSQKITGDKDLIVALASDDLGGHRKVAESLILGTVQDELKDPEIQKYMAKVTLPAVLGADVTADVRDARGKAVLDSHGQPEKVVTDRGGLGYLEEAIEARGNAARGNHPSPPADVPPSINQISDQINQLSTGLLSPTSDQGITEYLEALNNKNATTAIGDLMTPLMNEMDHQVSCARTGAIPRADCGCIATDGTVRTQNGPGDGKHAILSKQLGAIISALRPAYKVDLSDPPGSTDHTCAKTVDAVLAEIPANLKSTDKSLSADPYSAFTQAIDHQKNVKPSLINCVVIGMMQQKSGSTSGIGKLLTALDMGDETKTALDPANLYQILQKDPALSYETSRFMDDIKSDLEAKKQATLDTIQTNQPDTPLQAKVADHVSTLTSDLAMKALMNPSVYQPAMQGMMCNAKLAPLRTYKAGDTLLWVLPGVGQFKSEFNKPMTADEVQGLFNSKDPAVQQSANNLAKKMMAPLAVFAGEAAANALVVDSQDEDAAAKKDPACVDDSKPDSPLFVGVTNEKSALAARSAEFYQTLQWCGDSPLPVDTTLRTDGGLDPTEAVRTQAILDASVGAGGIYDLYEAMQPIIQAANAPLPHSGRKVTRASPADQMSAKFTEIAKAGTNAFVTQASDIMNQFYSLSATQKTDAARKAMQDAGALPKQTPPSPKPFF